MPAAASHTALTAQLAAKLPAAAACVEVWRRSDEDGGDRILAGLQDGTLTILDAVENASQAQAESSVTAWKIQRAFKSFGGRSLSQLQVSERRSLLLSLGDQGVSVHRLPRFQLTCQAGRTRSAKCFAWDDEHAMLCVAVKRRVLLLHYDGTDFVELKDIALPHSPHIMHWLGNSVCVAYNTGYALLNAETGEQTALPAIAKETPSALAPLTPSELLLALDNQSQVYGKDGKAAKRVLHWSAQPAAFVQENPYLYAFLPSGVEVRSLRLAFAHRQLQMVSAPAMTAASPTASRDGSIFAAAATELWQLIPLALLEQAQELASQGRFEEALDLCSLCPADQTEGRKALEDDLHVRYGHDLFESGAYDEAMVHFGMCSAANPVILLRLFPSLAPESLLRPVLHLFPDYRKSKTVEPEGESYRGALNMLLPYLLSWRTRLASASADDGSQSGSDTATSSIEPRVREDCDSQAAPESQLQQPPDSAPDLQHLTAEQKGQLAALLDTALLKAMLAMSDTGHLLRFVQRDNSIDLKEGQAALSAAGRYSELVALFQARGRHDQALDLIQQLSQSPSKLPVEPTGAAKDLTSLPGVWAAIKYIMALDSSEIDLIRQHARWILHQDSEAGIDMFAHMQPPLDPQLVLPIVQSEVPQLAVTYLESALSSGAASPEKFDNELAIKYLDVLLGKQPGSLKAPPSAVTETQAMDRLKALLSMSQHIDADRLLRLVPSGRLLEVRALLLERFGRHLEILRIYIDELGSPSLAEAYCDRVFAKRQSQQQASPRGVELLPDPAADEPPGHIYLQLAQVYLNPSPAVRRSSSAEQLSKRHADMANILSRKHDRLNPVEALNLMPDQMPLATMLPFLQGSLQGLGEKQRSASIVRSLQKAGNLQSHADLVQGRQRSVTVTDERACAICFKRIGTTAFVVTADGSVLQHLSCHKRVSRPMQLATGVSNGTVYRL